MENSLLDRSSALPVTKEILDEPLEIKHSEIKQVKSKKIFFSSLLIILFITIAFFLGYFFNRQTLVTIENSVVNQDKKTEKTEALAIASISPIDQKITTEFLFIKDPNKDMSNDLQAWLLTLDGSQKKIDLPDFSVAYKHPNSSQVFFIETKGEGAVSVKNSLNGEIKKFELIQIIGTFLIITGLYFIM